MVSVDVTKEINMMNELTNAMKFCRNKRTSVYNLAKKGPEKSCVLTKVVFQWIEFQSIKFLIKIPCNSVQGIFQRRFL